MPLVPGLPENCEATIDLQEERVQYLKKAYDKLAKPFEKILEENVPDLIVVDFAPHLIPEVAAKFGVPTAFFSVYTAATLAYVGPPAELKSGSRRTSPEHFTRPPEWIPFPSLVAHRSDYAPKMMRNTHFPDASGVSSGQRIAKIVEGCNFVIVRSCKEFEGEYINLVEELYQRPILPIGVLPPVSDGNMSHMAIDSSSTSTFKWKPEGIESSDLLPPGFANRTLSQGIVTLGWVPQSEILAHPAIGACLFHSGWGTIVEALCFGHPLILLPMVADQELNAKLLTEKEIGYEVPRNEDGSFNRDMVAKSVRKVMLEPEGEPLKLKASLMRNVFNNQDLHDSYINMFIQHLKKYKNSEGRKLVLSCKNEM
ncbi:unnamed protein product [Fraxinus pennsylvanica]|uniref:Uncharacterized protein n=1 Tax=Fraxinus pennsylvanica TaxID=56036 RepID=A0AAD2DVC0_9LAMI|nr:unnamed protein product [Fraxinus pennsylvanica]